AARDRARAARRPRGAHPRRARQRARPAGHALDARPAARLRRSRRHRAAVVAPAARGRGGRRPDRDHRRRPDRHRGHPRGAAGRRRMAGGPVLRPDRGAGMTTTRLTAVELRKATDTRAGFWLQLTTAGFTLAAVVILLVISARHPTLADVLSVAVQPAGVLLPIVGILLVTSEWSQRTALITF